jgi:hypothetical protein
MPIEADMMLADAAVIYGGFLSVIGAGWQIYDIAQPSPGAVAVMVRVPRDQLGMPHTMRLELLGADGKVFSIPLPNGSWPMIAEEEFTATGLDDPDLTLPVYVPIAVTVPPLPLEPDCEYVWRLRIDGKTRDRWKLAFRTSLRPGPSS